MTDRLIIALAQLNPTLGAISANLDRAREARREAADADLILFPELFICGYPPEDLVLRTSFVEACRAAVEELAKETVTGPAVLIGLPWREGANLYNSVALLANGKIEAVRHKFDLPNYGVFDEKRVFNAGDPKAPSGTLRIVVEGNDGSTQETTLFPVTRPKPVSPSKLPSQPGIPAVGSLSGGPPPASLEPR